MIIKDLRVDALQEENDIKKAISLVYFFWIIKQLITKKIIRYFIKGKQYKTDKNININHLLMLTRASTSIATLTMCIKMHFLTATKGCFLYDSFDI